MAHFVSSFLHVLFSSKGTFSLFDSKSQGTVLDFGLAIVMRAGVLLIWVGLASRLVQVGMHVLMF